MSEFVRSTVGADGVEYTCLLCPEEKRRAIATSLGVRRHFFFTHRRRISGLCGSGAVDQVVVERLVENCSQREERLVNRQNYESVKRKKNKDQGRKRTVDSDSESGEQEPVVERETNSDVMKRSREDEGVSTERGVRTKKTSSSSDNGREAMQEERRVNSPTNAYGDVDMRVRGWTSEQEELLKSLMSRKSELEKKEVESMKKTQDDRGQGQSKRGESVEEQKATSVSKQSVSTAVLEAVIDKDSAKQVIRNILGESVILEKTKPKEVRSSKDHTGSVKKPEAAIGTKARSEEQHAMRDVKLIVKKLHEEVGKQPDVTAAQRVKLVTHLRVAEIKKQAE